MINQPPSIPDPMDLLDWQLLNPTQTDLSPEHTHQAAHLSQSIRLPDQRWQVYLCSLGVLGFQQWIRDRAPDLSVQINDASIWQPSYANLIAAACQVRVGSFKLCIVTIGSGIEREVNLPIAALDLPDFAAHFYVLMQVVEEAQQAAVSGFLTYEQYRRYQEATPLQAGHDWTYPLPFAWFNPDPSALLLNLRCLEPNAIALPETASVRSVPLAVLKQKLTTLHSQLQTQPPWELLTLEEGMTVLKTPDLVNSSDWDPLSQPLISQPFINTFINVGLWLGNQLDAVAQELGWLLMPPPALSGLRSLGASPREEFDTIRSALEQQGVQIPLEARGAYRDLSWDQGGVRLYAVTWLLEENENHLEWMLLLALGAHPFLQMARCLRLEIRDETQLLFEESVVNDTELGVLYAQVIGDWGERFWVTVIADNEAVFEIPPFSFEFKGTSSEDEPN